MNAHAIPETSLHRGATCAGRAHRLLAPLLAAPLLAGAATLYVSPSGSHDAANRFDTWAGAATDIQAAVDAAEAGDIVQVEAGTTHALAAPVAVAAGITLVGTNGTGDGLRAVLDGGGAVRCFTMSHADAAIRGFIIRGGYVDAIIAGGGGYVTGGTVADCVVTNNFAEKIGATKSDNCARGGGLYVANGVVRNCLVAGNHAISHGSAIYAVNSLIEDCVVVSNWTTRTAGWGQGTIKAENTPVRRCVVAFNGRAESNRIPLHGGGIYLDGLSSIAEACHVASNSSVGAGGVHITSAGGIFRDGAIVGNFAVGGTGYGGGGAMVLKGAIERSWIASNWVGTSSAQRYGGGVWLSGADARLADCHVIGNHLLYYGNGGGVFVTDGTVTNCLIEKNWALRVGGSHGGSGQGVGMQGGRVVDCMIRENRAIVTTGTQPSFGGGVYLQAGLLERCLVVSNAIGYRGGGVYIGDPPAGAAPAEVRDCGILGNVAYKDRCGGIYAATNAIVRNTLVANNSSTNSNGGGVYWVNGTLESVTVARNLSKQGGGIYRDTAGVEQAATNVVVWHNTATDSGDDLVNPSDTAFAYSCAPGLAAGVNGNRSADPRFVDAGLASGHEAAPGDYAPRPGSPCVDAGVTLAWMAGARDVAGKPRLRGAGVDIGAYEITPLSTCIILR